MLLLQRLQQSVCGALLSFSMPLTFADHAPSTYSIKQNAKVVMTSEKFLEGCLDWLHTLWGSSVGVQVELDAEKKRKDKEIVEIHKFNDILKF